VFNAGNIVVEVVVVGVPVTQLEVLRLQLADQHVLLVRLQSVAVHHVMFRLVVFHVVVVTVHGAVVVVTVHGAVSWTVVVVVGSRVHRTVVVMCGRGTHWAVVVMLAVSVL